MKTPTPTWEEAIDEILDDFGHKAADGAERYGSILEAKSALTQLFKDLVAEAKPTKNRWHTHSEIAITQSCDICDQFEQNILKLLEEKDEQNN